LQLDYKYYLFTEIVISGGLCLYLASFFPQAYLAFLLYAFFIAAHSAQRAYLWSGPISILLLPAIIKQLAEQSEYWVMAVHIGMAYIFGFSFHLLVLNHRQGETIREQNAVLEQYLSQIERITLAEERSRLSKELHDTVGHAYTSLIMGLETLRPQMATDTGTSGAKSQGAMLLYRSPLDTNCKISSSRGVNARSSFLQVTENHRRGLSLRGGPLFAYEHRTNLRSDQTAPALQLHTSVA
jgi:hypothetical protein